MAKAVKPEVGSYVRVIVDRTERMKLYAVNVNRIFTKEGVVVASEAYDPEDTFRVHDLKARHTPLGIIDINSVTRIESLDGTKIEGVKASEIKDAVAATSFLVKSSDGKKNYTVTRNGKKFTCDCKAGQFGNACKHVKKIQAELGLT